MATNCWALLNSLSKSVSTAPCASYCLLRSVFTKMARRHLIKYANERNRQLGVTKQNGDSKTNVTHNSAVIYTRMTIKSYKKRWFLIEEYSIINQVKPYTICHRVSQTCTSHNVLIVNDCHLTRLVLSKNFADFYHSQQK